MIKKILLFLIILSMFPLVTSATGRYLYADYGVMNLSGNKIYFNTTYLDLGNTGGDVYLAGSQVNNFWYNQSLSPTITKWLYNMTNAPPWNYNQTSESIYYYNQTYLYYSDEDWIIQNATRGFNFNESKLSTIYYNATQVGIVEGTIDGGGLVDTQHQDGNYDGVTFNFSEVAGSPGLDLRLNFTGVADFNQGVMIYRTSSLAGEYPIIQMWNYDNSAWEDYPPVGEIDSFYTITQPVFDSSNHISGGVAQMRIYKASNGNTNNHYYVDWIAISKGYGTPSGEELDPYSIHRDGNISLIANWNAGDYNITAQNFNATNDIYIGGNTVKKWLYNMTTNSVFYYNQSLSPTITKWLYNQSVATTTMFNSSWTSTYNATYNKWAYNQTIASGGMVYTNLALTNQTNTFAVEQNFSSKINLNNPSGYSSSISTDSDGNTIFT